MNKEAGKLTFTFMPSFAKFLKEERLVEFIRIQLKYSREVNLPLLKFFESMTEEQLIETSIPGSVELLESFINDRVDEYLMISQKRWVENQLPVIEKHEVAPEDISLVSYIRKRGFLHFLPEYTNNMEEAFALISEIDTFLLRSDTISTGTYLNLLKEKIQEHTHFIERVTETSPGIIYVFDLLDDKEVYANKMMTKLLGYQPEDWKSLGDDFVSALIHPDDVPIIQKNQEYFRTAKDGEVRTIQYRIKDKSGKYHWMRTYESVFKRTEEGRPWQVIGIALDIEKEMATENQLQKREDQLLEAQELAEMGSFVWNATTGEREATPQFYKIIGSHDGASMDEFLKRVHPADRQKVKNALSETTNNRLPLDIEFRYEHTGAEKILWMKGTASQGSRNETIVKATLMDVTQRHHMIQKLQRSEDVNKKAQRLTHLGNWTWDMVNDTIEWSDELFEIHEIEHHDILDRNLVLKYIHPDDVDRVTRASTISVESQDPYDLFYRIITPTGKLKTLHAIGEVLVDETGKAYKMIGTLQDVTESEELIQRLQKSEALYKQAQSIAHLGNWIYDVKNDKMFWTDELYRIYGLEPQSKELNWEQFIQMVVADDRDLVNGFTSQAMRSGKPFEIYHRIKTDQAGERTLHIKGEVLFDNTGEIYQLFGTSQDVTEQQKIEQELRENQNFIKKIADATPSIIASYNVNSGKYRFVSQGIKTLLGYDPELVLDKGVDFFANLIHPNDLGLIMEKNSKALQQANSPDNEDADLIVDFQYRMKRADGEYRWFHTFGTIFDRNAQGKVEHVLNISIDITDRIKAEQTVEEQQRFISHIAEASPTILYLFDLEEKKFLYVNKEVTEVLGYYPEEIISLGDKVYTYLHPEDTIKSQDTYIKYKHSQGAASMHQFEGRIKSRDGEWKWLLTREIVFKRNQEGKAIQVLGSALDISDRKQMERTLSQKNIELEQSNANLGEFAYVASHDLQEPLRKISIFGDRLVANHSQNLDDDGKLFLDKIIESSKRMQGMINDLLSVSMLSGDKSFEVYSLDDILNEVLQTLEFKIEAKNAVIKADKLPKARVIPSQMRQLFQNLLSNSLKFTPKERTPQIEITQRSNESGELRNLNLAPGKQYIKIIISDNGIGFENEFASKIFTIFQRLHGRYEYEGSGIGLAICKKIVENHEGIIFAEGRPGIGSSFTIVIPIK